MAYVNASDIDILCKGTLYDLSLFAKNQGYNFSCNVIDFENYYHYGTANKSVLNLQNVTSDMVLLETSSGKIELKMDGAYLINLHITDANGRTYLQRVINKSNTGATYFTIYFGIDETNQLGSIALLTWRSGSNANFNAFGDILGNGFYNNAYAYNLIKGLVPPTYNWQSVPSISGKNGILNLAQIKAESINDGEPVDNVSTLDFDTLGNVNIPAIIDNQMPVDPTNPTSVTVGYLIPALTSGQYSALKILVKQDTIPKDENDADKVVDIEEPTNLLRIGSAVVSGLTPLSHYYFVVKVTDDADVSATSEPKDIVLDVAPPGTFFSPDFGTDGRDVLGYNPNKIIHVDEATSGYEPAGEGYDVICGALIDLYSPSEPGYSLEDGMIITSREFGWAYDVTDSQRLIPKNCTLTFSVDVYFTSTPGYVDWYIKDARGTTITYWCLDTKYSYRSGTWYTNKIVCTIEDGYLTLAEYYVNDSKIRTEQYNTHMCCIDEDNNRKMKYITYNPYRQSKIKNMSISWETT